MDRSTAFRLVTDELDRAVKEHDPMGSPHEGYAVLLEEVDELWAEVKANQGTTDRGVSEAVQIAAMAMRYLIDLCGDRAGLQHELKVERHYREHEVDWDMRGRTSGGCYSG